MSQALIGLLGAVIGATAATGTAVLIEWRRSRDEDRRWLRSKLDEAYEAVLLNLLRFEGMRSAMHVAPSGEATPILTKEDIPRWFEALVDARSSLQKLIVFCGGASRAELADADAQLAKAASRLLGGDMDKGYKAEPADKGLFALTADVRTVVVACARRDLRGQEPSLRSTHA